MAGSWRRAAFTASVHSGGELLTWACERARMLLRAAFLWIQAQLQESPAPTPPHPPPPPAQRYIIRLIFMVPVYATGSWFSLKYRDAAIYFDTIRDWCGAGRPK